MFICILPKPGQDNYRIYGEKKERQEGQILVNRKVQVLCQHPRSGKSLGLGSQTGDALTAWVKGTVKLA